MIPQFKPHPFLRSGHAQTLAGYYLPAKPSSETALKHFITLEDGDTVVLHDDCPDNWNAGDATALLIHGLAGCHQSGYMIRVAEKLNKAGIRTFRMDLRGCGSGHGLARLPYHAGRSEDALVALRSLCSLCPQSPTSVIGFSLGGNIVLKLLGESPQDLPAHLKRAVVISPSIDLAACVEWLDRPAARLYDRHFVKLLCQQLKQAPSAHGKTPPDLFTRKPRRLLEFDDRYTAPASGFGNAANYYARCSSAQFIPNIKVPALILTSRDDPLVPVQPFEELDLPSLVTLEITERGGHLGYISRSGSDEDRRWMDWRIVDWVTA